MTVRIPVRRESAITSARVIILCACVFGLAYMWSGAVESNAMSLLAFFITIFVIGVLFLSDILIIPEIRFKDDEND